MAKKAKESKEQKNEKTNVQDYKQAKINELTLDLQRLQAEFENYKKRTERDRIENIKYAEVELIKAVLPVLDNFELALKNKEGKDLLKGVELIYAQLFEVLENKGLKIMDAEGQKFDPYRHEALLAEESDKEPNTVLEVLQKGYVLNEKIIRAAKVKVARK